MISYPHRVKVRLAEYVDAATCAQKYVEPLARYLGSLQLGRVVASGTALRLRGRRTKLDLELADVGDETVGAVRQKLLDLGAPDGSLMWWDGADGKVVLPVTRDEPDEYDPAVVEQLARDLRVSYATLTVDRHAMAPATAADLARTDQAWYSRCIAELVADGFRDLGSFTIEVPNRPVSRKITSADGVIRGELGQARNKTADWRVLVLTTEFEDGRFLVTCNVPQTWNLADGMLAEYLPADTSLQAIHRRHRERLSRHATAVPRRFRDAADVIESEHRITALGAEFRRRQRTPDVAELRRLGTAPRLAALVVEEMRRLADAEEGITPAETPLGIDGMSAREIDGWAIVSMQLPDAVPQDLAGLVRVALEHGIRQVEAVGSPLNPFLLLGCGRTYFMMKEGHEDRCMEVVLEVLRSHAAPIERCALVTDSVITLRDGTRQDAITAMACERGAPEGALWAQGYRPKRLLRRFLAVGEPEQVATAKNLLDEAGA